MKQPTKITVSLKKQSKNNKTKKNKQKVQRSVKSNDTLAKYYLALCDPFHPGAVGAKVPDQFSCPTITQTVRASFTLTCNSNGNAGVIVLPNVITALACFNGTCPDFSTITWGDNTTTTQARWGVDPSTFASKMDNYRIVGYGVRTTGLSSMTNASGKFILGTYPITTNWTTKDFPVGSTTMATNANNTQFKAWSSWGVPTSGGTLSPGLLVNLPGSKVVSAIEAAENLFEINPRLSSPEAMNFRSAADTLSGFDQVPGATTGGDASYLHISGHEACYIYYTGGVASTSSFDVELIYHLEGKPNLNVGTTQAVVSVVPSQAVSASPVQPVGMLKVLEQAAKQPVVKQVIEAGANFIHPMLGKLAGAVLNFL